MTIQPRRARRTRHNSLACAVVVAGATAIVGTGASPSVARPDIGLSSGQAHAVAAGEPDGVVLTPHQRFVVVPTRVAGLMGVHVDGGWLLQ